jgi:ribonuclease HI
VPSPRRAPESTRQKAGRRTFSGRIDGGARGNPGPAGIGVLLEEEGGTRDEFYAYLGSTTNNVAEYAALLVLLVRALRRGATELTIHSDSELLVKQLEGTYRVKNPRLQALHAAARGLLQRIPRVTLRHVPREENRDADRLANRAMDERDSSEPLPEEVAALVSSPAQSAFSFGEGS